MLEYSVIEVPSHPHVLTLMIIPFDTSSLVKEAVFESLFLKCKGEDKFSGDTHLDTDGIYSRIYFQNKYDALLFKLMFQENSEEWELVSGPAW